MVCVIALALMWAPISPCVVAGGFSAVHRMGESARLKSMPTEVTLTDQRTAGSIAIPANIVREPPPVLRLRVTKVVNPENTAFQIFIYLSAGADPGQQPAGRRIPVGNVALFPADRPGAFQLRDAVAFDKLKASLPHANQGQTWLLLEIRRLHPSKPWTRVEVTFAQPEWIAEPGK
jgi:hypothetical protein